MNTAQDIYVTKLAEKARSLCEDNGIIHNNTFIISPSEIENIVKYFNGTVEQKPQNELSAICNNKRTTCFMQKAKDDEDFQFAICYCGEMNVLNILYELGYVFLNLSIMQPDEICCYQDVSFGVSGIAASKFARAFAMPIELFKQAVLENFENGSCDIKKVAMKFGVASTQVTSRGREIFLWA